MENKKSMPKLKRSMTAGQMEMISLGGAISIIKVKDLDENKWEEIIKFIYEKMQYVEICDSG